LGLLTLEESFYLPVFSGNAAEATYQAELALKDQSLESCLDRVALAGLMLGERDQERGILGREQSECITVMVKEMLDNLADFEPRRWFSNLGPERAGGPPGDLASLSTTENGEDSEALIERNELAPGWVVDEPILSIGGRSMLDEAAVAILAEVLKKRGLGVHVLPPEAISAAHIATLASTEAKLVCLAYLGMRTGPAHIRYLVRRLRRILPEGTSILICFWADESDSEAVKALLATAEADAYATSLQEAVEICIEAELGSGRVGKSLKSLRLSWANSQAEAEHRCGGLSVRV
jgi:hypothetical protein